MIPKQQARTLLLGLILLVGCSGVADPDLCRRAEVDDVDAYVRAEEARRAQRERVFRSSESSPVPEESRATWSGLEYFPVDATMRVQGPLVRRTNGRSFEIVTTSGDRRPCEEIGYFLVDLGAGPEKLPVYELLDQSEEDRGLFVPFTDATTADETYPAGRYLEPVEVARGSFLLDFNLAYNPSCAYGGRFQCPVTPEESRLRAALRVGEKGWHEKEG